MLEAGILHIGFFLNFFFLSELFFVSPKIIFYWFTTFLFSAFSSHLALGVCMLSRPVVSNCLQPHALQPTRLCPWDFPGKNTGVGCHFLSRGIFLTQESNLYLLCLLHCRQVIATESPRKLVVGLQMIVMQSSLVPIFRLIFCFLIYYFPLKLHHLSGISQSLLIIFSLLS